MDSPKVIKLEKEMIPDSENRGQCKLYLHYVNDSSFRCRYSIYIYLCVCCISVPPSPSFFLLISFHSPLGCHSVCGLPVLLYILPPERECTDDAMLRPDQSQCRHFQVYPKLAPRKFPLSLSSPCIWSPLPIILEFQRNCNPGPSRFPTVWEKNQLSFFITFFLLFLSPSRVSTTTDASH